MIRKENAVTIGNEVGTVHLDSINHRTVVNQRYLRLILDLNIIDPILAGLFQKRKKGEDF